MNLKKEHVIVDYIDDEELFTREKLAEFNKKHKFKRIIIEYNGMWNHKNIQLPSNWELEQQISVFDTSTFKMYYNNMKSKVGDMVRNSELIIFNRANQSNELSLFKRSIKMINPSTDICFIVNDVEVSVMLEEELPYDISADKLPITEETYGAWFLDTLDNTSRYIGKEVEFIGKVLKKDELPNDYFVPIRLVMACCEDDLSSLGFVCHYEGASSLEEGTWVKIKATIGEGEWPNRGEVGPILHAGSVSKTDTPTNEVIGIQ